MTNAQIIFEEAVRLMKDGKIGTTGRVFKYADAEGQVHELPEPEAIHTFAHWKALGYAVRRGEHAVSKIPVWKYRAGRQEAEGDPNAEPEPGKMFMKVAAFFAASQVEAIARA